MKLREKLKIAEGMYETESKYFGLNLMSRKMLYKIFYKLRPLQLANNIQDIWNYDSVLYVGFSKNRWDFAEDFSKKGYRIDAVEIFEPNFSQIKDKPWINNAYLNDIRNIDDFCDSGYDVIFWWHGPEHIDRQDLGSTLSKLKERSRNLVVCGSPWGKYNNNFSKENPFEEHKSSLYPEDFHEFGFQTSTLGIKDFPGSNLLAWCRPKEHKT